MADAAPLFADDAESGTRLTTDNPPGKWTAYRQDVVINSMTASAAAAHRGAFGWRHVDTDSRTVPDGQNTLVRDFTTSSSALYIRFWTRRASGGGGEVFLFQMRVNAGASPGSHQGQLGGILPSGQLFMAGYDSSSTYFYDSSSVVIDWAQWHLIEVEVVGLGTATGASRAWVDGAPFFNRTVSRLTQSPDGFELGEYYANNASFTGSTDFDDVRLDTTPSASRFVVQSATVPEAGCGAVVLDLQHVSGQSAGAPYALVANVSASGVGGAFYSEATCSTATSTVPFALGQAQATVWFRASGSGVASVTATHVDLLSGSGNLTVTPLPTDAGSADAGATPDAGTAPGDARYLVGCGCGAAGATLPALWLFAGCVSARAARGLRRARR